MSKASMIGLIGLIGIVICSVLTVIITVGFWIMLKKYINGLSLFFALIIFGFGIACLAQVGFSNLFNARSIEQALECWWYVVMISSGITRFLWWGVDWTTIKIKLDRINKEKKVSIQSIFRVNRL